MYLLMFFYLLFGEIERERESESETVGKGREVCHEVRCSRRRRLLYPLFKCHTTRKSREE
tara:strand:+ start:338 stop:517 length:180 start_codon:yes stop_codon:yes gene_type:complete